MDFANNPSFIRQGPSATTRLFIYAMLSIALIIADSQFGALERIRTNLSVAMYPFQWVVSAPAALVDTTHHFLTTQVTLQAENTALKKQHLAMMTKLLRWETLEYNYQLLRKLNALKSTYDNTSQLAEVLYTGRDPFTHKIIIDKGENAHVRPGQPVVDSQGLIGQITRVQPLTAEVTLIVDKMLMVPVMLQRTGVRAILYGYGGGVEVKYLPVHTDIRPGDLLVTSGIDGLYPEGLPVARVTQVERNTDNAFIRLITIPVSGVQSGRFVMVLKEKNIIPPPPASTENLSATPRLTQERSTTTPAGQE